MFHAAYEGEDEVN